MFNGFVIMMSVLTGLSGGLVARRVLATAALHRALLAGVAAGAAGSALALAAVAVTVSDAFAALHMVYGILTISIPLAAAAVATRWRRLPLWVRIGVCAGLLVAPIGLYATHIEPFWLRVDRVEITVPALTAGSIRIGVLSDLQTPEIGAYENRAIDTLLAQEPDVVLIPGDFWQFRGSKFTERAPQFAAVMERIGASVPYVFAVNGNTDRVEGLLQITEGSSVMVLDNSMTEFTIDGVTVRILGITFDGDESGLPAATTAFFAPAPEPVVRIVLGHQPDEIDRFSPGDPIDLIVAGHTHGGQVAIPLIGPLITLSSVPRSVAAGGLHQLDGHNLYVSTGVGRERAYAPQVRFGVRPSLGVLDLVAGP